MSIDEQTAIDIHEDFLFLESIILSYSHKIDQFKKRIKTLDQQLSPLSYNQTIEYIDYLQASFQTLHTAIRSRDDKDFQEFLRYYEQLRGLIGISTGILTNLDSQSPSFFSVSYSQAGQYTGSIKQSYNDYARDQHQAGNSYEKLFLNQYIDAPLKFPFHVYATQSGMAALTTIAGFILGEERKKQSILIGSSCYFEEKFLLTTLFGKEYVQEVDDTDIETLEKKIIKAEPQAVFLDSLSNSVRPHQPNLLLLLSRLKKHLKKSCYIVIDNTGLSCTFQPFAANFAPHPKTKIILWESLLKHHQFGMDRVNGGIIYTNIARGINIYTYRDHLGTNISDTSAFSLPLPNRRLLLSRLQRHERNTQLLKQRVTTALKDAPSFVADILVSTEPHVPFHGALISLCFKEKYKRLSVYQTFVKNIFNAAKKKNIPLVGGTSFGFPLTRVYIPASRPGQGEPFVRIATGTEPLKNFLEVIDLICTSLY